MKVDIPDNIYYLVKKYSEKKKVSETAIVVSAILHYISMDPSIIIELFEERKKLEIEEFKALLKIVKEIPKTQRMQEKIVNLVGEENFNSLLKKGVLIPRKVGSVIVFDISPEYYKLAERYISKDRYKKQTYRDQKEISVQIKKEYTLYKKKDEKFIFSPNEKVPDTAELIEDLVNKGIEIVKKEFYGNAFTLEDIVGILKSYKEFSGMSDKELELYARAIIAELTFNGEVYFPEENKIMWV